MVLWGVDCLLLGLAPDRPLEQGQLLRLSAAAFSTNSQGEPVGWRNYTHSLPLDFAAGGWAAAFLPLDSCLPWPPPLLPGQAEQAGSGGRRAGEGEGVLAVSFELASPVGVSAGSGNGGSDHSSGTGRVDMSLRPSLYYKQAPLSLLRRWGLPPATPGFGHSAALAAGRLHALAGWRRATPPDTTLPSDAIRDLDWWRQPAAAVSGSRQPWRAANEQPGCAEAPDCEQLGAEFRRWRAGQPVRPSLEQQAADWAELDSLWQRHKREGSEEGTARHAAATAATAHQAWQQPARKAASTAGSASWLGCWQALLPGERQAADAVWWIAQSVSLGGQGTAGLVLRAAVCRGLIG